MRGQIDRMSAGIAPLVAAARRRARHAARILRGNEMPSIVLEVRDEGLTYLGEKALLDLYDQVRRVEIENLNGRLIEAGCALGGSAIVMGAAKQKERSLDVYDVFDMIPPPSDVDGEDVHERFKEIARGESAGINGAIYYGYMEDLYSTVKGNFERRGVPVEQNNVQLIRGLFQDTMKIDGPVALAHIDGDWYESVMTCLINIEPKIVSGGVLIIDDYDCWSGCRKAVDEYFAARKHAYTFVKRSRLQIFRK